jgi:hypothetical protein
MTMKKNSFILSIFFMCSMHVFAASTIDERMSDIYFANGILTTEDEASVHKERLYQAVVKKTYAGSESAFRIKHGKSVKLAYNYSFKKNFGKSVGALLDVMESYEQLTNTSVGWRLFDSLVPTVSVGMHMSLINKV